MSELLEPLPTGVSREEYCAWAMAQPRGRFELVDGAVVVNCGERADGDAIVAPFPLIIVDVTSSSQSRVDLATKATDYLRLPSLGHHIIIHLAKRVVLHHRKLEDGRIEIAILGTGAVMLDPPGISVTVEALLAEA